MHMAVGEDAGFSFTFFLVLYSILYLLIFILFFSNLVMGGSRKSRCDQY